MDTSNMFQWVLMMYKGYIIIGVGMAIFWIWMLIDCVQNVPLEGNEKLYFI